MCVRIGILLGSLLTLLINLIFNLDGYSPLQQQMGQHEIPLEIHKLAVVIVLLVLAGFSNWATLAYIHDFVGM
jgi:ABC-type lipoprotein release transport system permease subunit